MPISTKVSLKDCPFCSTKESGLYIGPTSGLSWGIECKCGCSITEDMPNEYNKRANKKIDQLEAQGLTYGQAIAAFHLLNVAKKWNTRGQ
jgi:hypothetical protein